MLKAFIAYWIIGIIMWVLIVYRDTDIEWFDEPFAGVVLIAFMSFVTPIAFVYAFLKTFISSLKENEL